MGTLVNAIKAIFASKKTTDSNYAVPLLNKNDASPAGYMELPDLAAVAAGISLAAVSVSDADSITSSGQYRINGTNANSGETDWGVLFHINHNANIAHQIKFCANVKKVLYRKKYNNVWGSWIEIVS